MKISGLLIAGVLLLVCVPITVTLAMISPQYEELPNYRIGQLEQRVQVIERAAIWLASLLIATLMTLIVSLVTYVLTTRRQRRDTDPYRHLGRHQK